MSKIEQEIEKDKEIDNMIEESKKREKTNIKRETKSFGSDYEKPLSKEELEKALVGLNKPVKWLSDTLDLAHEGDAESKTILSLLEMGIYLGFNCEVLIVGDSSSGKSNLMTNCLKLMHKRDREIIIGATGAALKRIEKLLNDKRVIALKEMDGIDKEDTLATQMVKMMSSDDEGGSFIQCIQDGMDWEVGKLDLPEVSFFSTYAKSRVDREVQTRFWIIEVDQSNEHTNNVLKKKVFNDPFEQENDKTQFELRTNAWKQKIIPLLENKEDVEVYPTCLETLQKMFQGDNDSRVIRDSRRFLILLKIITLLHYAIDTKSRPFFEHSGKEWVCSTPQDFVIACEIAWKIIQRNVKNLRKSDEDMLDTLRSLYEINIEDAQKTSKNGTMDDFQDSSSSISNVDVDGVDIKTLTNEVGISYEYGRQRLKQLSWMGYIEYGKSINDGRKTVYRPLENQKIEEWNIYLKDIKEEAINKLKDRGIKPALIEEMIKIKYHLHDGLEKDQRNPEIDDIINDRIMDDEKLINDCLYDS